MTTCMNYFGTSDLREILQLITQNPSVTVWESRPSKVRHYIQVCLNTAGVSAAIITSALLIQKLKSMIVYVFSNGQ